MIEIRHLRSLKAIAESGKLANAAERVHLTQSALSHQIRAIENHYEITLFERTAQGLRFTPVGERLLECHTCFDWLTPVIDAFRRTWPEVELDLVAGFHSDPWGLIKEGKADIVIGGLPDSTPAPAYQALAHQALFKFEIVAVLPNEHVLHKKPYLQAADFSDETLITYPVPEERIDLIRHVLSPAGIKVTRRTSELTIAIMQLVASRRGLAALPSWGVQSYIEHEYVIAKSIGKHGLWSELYATALPDLMLKPYVMDFVSIIRTTCLKHLKAIQLF